MWHERFVIKPLTIPCSVSGTIQATHNHVGLQLTSNFLRIVLMKKNTGIIDRYGYSIAVPKRLFPQTIQGGTAY